MSAYDPVGWWNDETHPLSQTNLKTVDQGIKDAHLLDSAEVTSGTEAVLTLTVPPGTPGCRVVGRGRSDAAQERTNLTIRPNGLSTSGYQTQRIEWFMGSSTPGVVFNTGETSWATGSMMVAADSSSNRFGICEFVIPRLSGSEQKEIRFIGGCDPQGASAEARSVHGLGRRTIGDITTIELRPGSGSWVAGTRFNLLLL